MSGLDSAARALVVAALLAAMSVFMHATLLILIALVLGGAMVVLGSLYLYRPGAMMGLVIVAMCAASSIDLDSILEVGKLLTAILGLLLPLFLLALRALKVEDEDSRILPISGRPALQALAFGLACVLSAPIVAGLTSVAVPATATQLSGVAETAMLLLAAAGGSMLLTRQARAKRTVGQATEATEEGAA